MRFLLLILCLNFSGCCAVGRSIGSSMYPNVQNGDVSVYSLCVKNIERGDIIGFYHEDNIHPISIDKEGHFVKNKILYNKRVIGLPGEKVSFHWKIVYIDDRELEEPYIVLRDLYPDSFIILGPDEYYVMGDNRPDSRDSRVIGPIKKEAILYKKLFRIWRQN